MEDQWLLLMEAARKTHIIRRDPWKPMICDRRYEESAFDAIWVLMLLADMHSIDPELVKLHLDMEDEEYDYKMNQAVNKLVQIATTDLTPRLRRFRNKLKITQTKYLTMVPTEWVKDQLR